MQQVVGNLFTTHIIWQDIKKIKKKVVIIKLHKNGKAWCYQTGAQV